MNIFLTGAKGFIGSHLMVRLINDGHQVITDMRQFHAQSYDLVIHLAAKTHIGNQFDPELFNSNILFAGKIMRTPHRLIYASSCSAAHLTNPYAYTKRFNEHLGAIHGNSLGLRFHNVYGPKNNKGLIRFLMMQNDKSRVTIRGPKLIRDYIHIDDVVNMIAICAEDSRVSNSILDVGTGTGIKTIDVVNLFQEISCKRFILDFAEHGTNEPEIMISNNAIAGISLEGGIKKLIYD